MTARKQSWLDDSTQTPLIDSYVQKLGTFVDAMADGHVDDSELQTILDTIIKAARTGQIGDGKIFVYSIDHAVRIRTGETDSEAL